MRNKIRLSLVSISLFVCACAQTYTEIDNSESFLAYDQSVIEKKEFRQFLKHQMDLHSIPGISIAVVNDGKIAALENLGYTNRNTKQFVRRSSMFEAASLSKPVFAFFTLQLAERGAIELTRPLHYYLPDSSLAIDKRYESVNAIHVLSHSSGFPNWRWFDSPPEPHDVERGEFFMLAAPGEKFSYSGEGYDYLSRVLAKNTGATLYGMQGLMERYLHKPLGIEHMYFTWNEHLYDTKVFGHTDESVTDRSWGAGLPHQNSFMFSAAGALHTNAENYARFIIALMEEQGLSSRYYQLMFKPRTKVHQTHARYLEDGITHWSMGFAVVPKENDLLYVHGGTHSDFQSQVAFSKDSRFGYVFFVNNKKGDELNMELKRFLRLEN